MNQVQCFILQYDMIQMYELEYTSKETLQA